MSPTRPLPQSLCGSIRVVNGEFWSYFAVSIAAKRLTEWRAEAA